MGRIGPQIAQWASNTISACANPAAVEVIDLSDWYLPMDDEPFLPATGEYTQPHTRQWSAKIAEGDMFIFIFPQYNWGYPAALKNAIDHLYNEWKGKPALLISYANRGGGKAAAQLRQVLEGIGMQPMELGIEIKLSDLSFEPDGSIAACDASLYQYRPTIAAALKQG